MLRQITSSLALLVWLPSVGCIAESGDPAPGTSHDLAERLREPVSMAIIPTEDGSFARVQAVTLRDGEASEVEVSLTGGTLGLSLDDAGLRVESLEVEAADVTVGPATMPPDGATLTGISVALAAPVEVSLVSSSESAVLSEGGGMPVDLRWAVELDYGTVDLAPIRLPTLPFELSVELDDAGEVQAHLTASQPGSFWSWAGIFELRDLDVDLVATTGLDVPGPVD